jgi:hypothetical protein
LIWGKSWHITSQQIWAGHARVYFSLIEGI